MATCEFRLEDGTICGKECKSEYLLKNHMITHTGVRRDVLDEPAAKGNITSARSRSDSGAETLAEKVARLRQSRIPIGVPEKKWACPEGDGYQYRVFNDNWMTRPDNIQRALRAGYEFVNSDEDKQRPQTVGTNDNGTPIRGFLMRIPKEIYEEDQKAKQKEVDKVDEQIRTGSFQQGAGDNRYIPTTGINIQSNTQPPA